MLRTICLLALILLLPLGSLATEAPRKRNARTGLQITAEDIRTARPAPDDPGKAAKKNVTFIQGRPDDDGGDGDNGDGNGDDGGSGGDADTRDPEPRGPVIDFNWDLWNHFDATEQDVFASESETFAGNLVDGDPKRANKAMCICVEAGQPGYSSPPGYGNSWDQRLNWTRTAPNSGLSTLVMVTFDYNLDTEPGRDFLWVQWNNNGTWIDLLQTSGTNRDPSGLFVTKRVFNGAFTINPGEYTGAGADQIQLRIRVTTDAYGSDEDGFFPSNGAAQIDNIGVSFDLIPVSVSDFDTVNDGWVPGTGDAAGDFAKLLPLVQDLEPCYQNDSFQFTFIDDGTPAHNGGSTGGETSVNWSYGPGGFVVNHTGGISPGGVTPLNNLIESAAFAWDVPGTDDDAKHGAMLFFRVWEHLPLENGIFYQWYVRSYNGSSAHWTAWRNHGLAHYGSTAPHHRRQRIDVSTLMTADPDSVQIRLGVLDLADALSLPGGDATPSPMFDDVGFGRYEINGPVITARSGDLFQDSFANLGATDFDVNAAARDVRLDMSRDIQTGASILPGDSMVVAVAAVRPASSITSVRLYYALKTSGLFPGTRTPPGPILPLTGLAGPCAGGAVASGFHGFVDGVPVTNQFGDPIPGRYSLDLPDAAAHPNGPHQAAEASFFLAGDVMQYYVEAIDNLGGITTLPEDITGYQDFRECSGFDPEFTIHALPGLTPGPGPGPFLAPEVLVVQNGGGKDQYQVIRSAFHQNGLVEGVDYDHFLTNAPGSGLGNGWGASGAKGASADQLDLYSTIFFFAHDNSTFLMSDGTGQGLNDKSDDLALFANWRGADADRATVWMGDNLVSGMVRQGRNFLVEGALGASLFAPEVRTMIGDQISPTVSPTGAGPTSGVYATDFVAGACLGTEQFDALLLSAGANRWISHEFLDAAGISAYPAAAGIWHDRTVTPVATVRRRVDATFPVAFASMIDPAAKAPGTPDRAALLGEILTELGHAGGLPVNTPSPVGGRFGLESVHPNPFNPSTTIRFSLAQPGPARLRVFDLRGREVAVLMEGSLAAGPHRVRWNGRGHGGAPVASGVYLASLEAGARRDVTKLVLLK